jgi:hypothetical protein
MIVVVTSSGVVVEPAAEEVGVTSGEVVMTVVEGTSELEGVSDVVTPAGLDVVAGVVMTAVELPYTGAVVEGVSDGVSLVAGILGVVSPPALLVGVVSTGVDELTGAEYVGTEVVVAADDAGTVGTLVVATGGVVYD